MVDHFYTTSESERDNAVNLCGYRWESVACYVLSGQAAGSTPLYRLCNPTVGDHFYTTYAPERENAIAHLGYRDEGVVGYVQSGPAAGTVALYRGCHPTTGDHFYTTGRPEMDSAVAKLGYRDEGVACYVHPSWQPGATPLYRLWEDGHPLKNATGFTLTWIAYDLPAGKITNSTLDALCSWVEENPSSGHDSREPSGLNPVSENSEWRSPIILKDGVTVTTSVEGGIPLVVVAKDSLALHQERDVPFVHNSPENLTRCWSWKQPMDVPPNSALRATIAVYRSEITVPYVASGTFTWPDGLKEVAMMSGDYRGTNSHDIFATLGEPASTVSSSGRQILTPQATSVLKAVS